MAYPFSRFGFPNLGVAHFAMPNNKKARVPMNLGRGASASQIWTYR